MCQHPKEIWVLPQTLAGVTTCIRQRDARVLLAFLLLTVSETGVVDGLPLRVFVALVPAEGRALSVIFDTATGHEEVPRELLACKGSECVILGRE